MSLPIAREVTDAPKKAIEQAVSAHGHRVDALADRIALHIESLVPQGRARCLDLGRGDLSLAEAVQTRVPRTEWRCIDVERMPADLRSLEDEAFDVALLCDALHDGPDAAANVLAEAARVARYVLVKDHFEHGPPSRPPLELLDFDADSAGARARCFSREGFVRLAAAQQLVITALDAELDLYARSPGMETVRRDWQFIAVLSH